MNMTWIVAGVLALGLGYWGYNALAGTPTSGGCCSGMMGMHHATAPATTTTPATEPTTQKAVYVCPMDSDVVSAKPGKCPKCGMALVKK